MWVKPAGRAGVSCMAMACCSAAAAGQAPTSQTARVRAREAQIEAPTRGGAETRNHARRFDSISLTVKFYHSRHIGSRWVAKMPLALIFSSAAVLKAGN